MTDQAGGKDPYSKIRHDLRTPVNQIIGYSEMLQEQAEEEGGTAYVADLVKINQAARRLLALQDELFAGLAAAPRPEAPPAPAAPAPSAAEPSPVPAPASAPPAAAPPATPPARTASETRSGPGALLVVDDNELNRDMLSRRLKAKGYKVETAEDGYQALEKLGTGHHDLVLLDVMMPGLSGLDVLKTLREARTVASLPVIMATAKDGSEDIVEALKLGANDYVTKPLDFPVVLARVQTQLTLKRLSEDLELHNRFIRNTFGRYLSDEIVASLLESPEGLALGGERRTVTILMSDLRGFTSTAERVPPEQVTGMLNVYLGAMADVIMEYRGTIDEFIGDAILAIFGAPIARPDDALRAVACAAAMQRAMGPVNERLRQAGFPQVEMGIAVNTGEVVVGNIGSDKRAKYGVVGTPINLTSRIETYTVGGQVLIADQTLRAAGPAVRVGHHIEIKAKGAKAPITAHYLEGVGAPYDVEVPVEQDDGVELARPAPLRFFVVEGKAVGDEALEGALTRLGSHGGDVRTEHAVEPLTNVKARLLDPAGAEVPGDLYAKVQEARPGGFRVRFTSVPPEVKAFLDGLRAGPSA